MKYIVLVKVMIQHNIVMCLALDSMNILLLVFVKIMEHNYYFNAFFINKLCTPEPRFHQLS